MISWNFLRKPKCQICGRVLQKDRTDVIQYRVADREEIQEMKICKQCGDKLEEDALKPEDFSE